ncbi:MAG: Fpg/Nei family DNA glycosylase [Myxococcota bacterium]
MPELPDVTVYVEALAAKTRGETLEDVRLGSPFLLRSTEPSVHEVKGRKVTSVERLGKRIVVGLDGDLFVVIHLMIAGRFKWTDKRGAAIPGRVGLAAFDFSSGTLLLTEASSKKRASLHLVRGREGLSAHHRGGIEVLGIDLETFSTALRKENHTIKRSLTDPRIFSGIGNAYSDEILFEAGLSPMRQTQKLTDEEMARLHAATQTILTRFTDAIRSEAQGSFPTKVTAFRDDMMVHGRFREPCKVCGTKVMRVAFADNELNYCPRCQNEGRLLADRSLSRLMKKDWPKTVEELEG